MHTFNLIHSGKHLGEVLYKQGKFYFKLADNIHLDDWRQKFGIIPLQDSDTAESEDLFPSLNMRLPIYLRNASLKRKIEYIKKKKLRVASDRYELV